MADVSAVSSTAASASLSAGKDNLKIGYDTFLKLLTTQLQHQDPTSPLDTNQFTTQLVQMTGVQQQLLSNELLQSLIDKTGASGVGGAVDLIGKTVHAAGDTAQLDGGQARYAYGLAAGAASATLTITDSNGKVVWTGNAPSTTQGRHDWTWDGKDSDGKQLPDGGLYTLSVAAKDSAGGKIASATEVTGVVTSVEIVNGSPVLNLGKTKVLYSAVNQVEAVAGARTRDPIVNARSF